MLKEDKNTLELIKGVLDKNRVAEEKFYDKYKKIIEDYLKSKFPKIYNDDFDDCVSNILIKIFYNLDKYDPEKSSFKSWVLTITKHYMIDAWRCNVTVSNNVSNDNQINFTCSCKYESDENGLPEWTNNIITSPNTFTYSNDNNTITLNSTCDFEICNSITHISNQISSSDFTLLNMKYIQGYEYCEIGKEFELTSSTVSNRVNYLKTKLKKNNCDLFYD